MSDHDNRPAFPCEWDYIGTNRAAANGMELRDYFAAKAMHAYVSTYPCQALAGETQVDPECIAGDAYELADAMLKARGA